MTFRLIFNVCAAYARQAPYLTNIRVYMTVLDTVLLKQVDCVQFHGFNTVTSADKY